MSFSQRPHQTMDEQTIKYTATRLQCASNYKLRIESAKNEPRLDRLLGHIAIYDAVREWRQSQARASIETIMQATRKLTHQSSLNSVTEEETQPEAALPGPSYITQSQIPALADFQAAIELQLATMERVKAAHRQLQQMADDDKQDGEEVEEYESDSDADSDYDSYDGEDGLWRDEEEDCESEDSMTDPESVRSEPPSPFEEKEFPKEDGYFDSISRMEVPRIVVSVC